MSYYTASALAEDPLSDAEGGYLSDVLPSLPSQGSSEHDADLLRTLDRHFSRSQTQTHTQRQPQRQRERQRERYASTGPVIEETARETVLHPPRLSQSVTHTNTQSHTQSHTLPHTLPLSQSQPLTGTHPLSHSHHTTSSHTAAPPLSTTIPQPESVLLRREYEARVKSLSSALSSLYDDLCRDELLQEMRKDPASVVFLPAHLNEVIERFLTQERENAMHALMRRTISLESELVRERETNTALRAECESVTQRAQTREHALQRALTQAKQALQQKTQENAHLHEITEKKKHEISVLEQSFAQSARELDMIENIDKEERAFKEELKTQLAHITQQRNTLHEEVTTLRVRATQLAEENARLAQAITERDKAENANRARLKTLMSQVESMLDEETHSHTQALQALHAKTKSLRTRLVTELQREKRLSAALQEELTATRASRDERERETRRALEEETTLRERLSREETHRAALQQEILSLQQKLREEEKNAAEHARNAHTLQEKLTDREERADEERERLTERVRLQIKAESEEEQRRVEQRTHALKLHYENELARLSSELRGSYVFPHQQLLPSHTHAHTLANHNLRASVSVMSDAHRDVLNGLGTNSDTLHTEISYRQLLAESFAERERMLAQHENALVALRDTLTQEHTQTLREREETLTQRHNERVSELQRVCAEAAQNIDRLKGMVRDARAAVNLQKERLTHVQRERDELARQLCDIQSQSQINTQTPIQTPPVTKRHAPSHALTQTQSRTPSQKTLSLSTSVTPNTTFTAFRAPLPKRDSQGESERDVDAHNLSQQTNRLFSPSHNTSISYKNGIDNDGQSFAMAEEIASHTDSQVNSQRSSSTSIHPHTQSTPTHTPTHTRRGSDGSAASARSVSSHISQLSGDSAVKSVRTSHTVRTQEEEHYSVRTPVITHKERSHTPTLSMTSSVRSSHSLSHSHTPRTKQSTQAHAQQSYNEDEEREELSNNGEDTRLAIASQRCASLQSECETLRARLAVTENALSQRELVEQSLRETLMAKEDELVRTIAELNNALAKERERERENDEDSSLSHSHRSRATAQLTQPYHTAESATARLFEEEREHHSLSSSSSLVITKCDQSITACVDTADIAVNTATDLRTSELCDRIARLENDAQRLRDSLTHREELAALQKQELESERARVLEQKQEAIRLRALLVKVDEVYRSQTHALRQDLQQMRNTASSVPPWMAAEVQTTISHYKLQFQVIFDRYRAREEERDKELRARMAVSHKKELDRLEDRFVAQIHTLHEKHSKELSKLHTQLLVRTEQAVNHSHSHSSADPPAVALSASPQNASALLSRSLEMLSQSSLKLQSHSQSQSQSEKQIPKDSSSVATSLSSSRAAFASVLQGVLQGLQDQACVEEETARRIEALARAHQEPSLAASAAARSMVGEAVDRFVLEVMRRKYADAVITDMLNTPTKSQ